jgi:outer membrane receptor for monomeric catechols
VHNQFATAARYLGYTPSYAMADLNASHRLATRVESVLQVQNLTDRYTNDFWGTFATMGRQTRLGFRIRT